MRSGLVRRQFTGPGEKMVLVTARDDAVLVWLKQRYRMNGQNGVCCAVFRNEGRCLSSALVHSAMDLVWRRWPGERLFTYVDPRRVRSRNPGYCFLRAGWRRCGRSKGGLLLLEVPEAEPLGINPVRAPSRFGRGETPSPHDQALAPRRMSMPSVPMDAVLVGDCLDLLPSLPDRCVDLILCDLPYGCTARNSWDRPVPLAPLWAQYRRVIRERGAIVLTGQGAFSADLVQAGRDLYRYGLVWRKNKPRGFLNANRQPLRAHEDILVFYRRQPTYHPQKSFGHPPVHAFRRRTESANYGAGTEAAGGGSTERYPTSIIEVPVVNNDRGARTHPTE